MGIQSVDADLLVHGVHPSGKPIKANLTWQSNERRWYVDAVGTKILGYIYQVHDGTPMSGAYGEVRTGWPLSSVTAYVTAYRATDREGRELGSADNKRAAAQLIIDAAHTPRPVGRPEIGPAFSLRFPAELLDQVDAAAKAEDISRAEKIRRLVIDGLSACPLDGDSATELDLSLWQGQ